MFDVVKKSAVVIMECLRRNAQVLQVVVGAIGLVSLLLIFLQLRDLRETAKWNQANAQHTFLENLRPYEVEKELWHLIKRLGHDPYYEIPEDVAKELVNDSDKRLVVRAYLNKFADLVIAIDKKYIDKDYAFDVEGGSLPRTYCVYQHVIKEAREQFQSDKIYAKFEKLAKEWTARSGRQSLECSRKTSP